MIYYICIYIIATQAHTHTLCVRVCLYKFINHLVLHILIDNFFLIFSVFEWSEYLQWMLHIKDRLFKTAELECEIQ